MRPIELTISGLHSFREKQTIDFESLCNGGVFGIFGPTGSGKSSILDAMTLALYGKVERAANNTYGILNHAENQVNVAFTFELTNRSEQIRYTIERVLKRTDEYRVKTTVCRFIEHRDEQVVLADKTNEVNAKIEALLGLTIDDFTRAVVLPQGKFAEFLSLKGAERRQMLQRLFNLEQYGDELSKKLKRHLQSAKGQQAEFIAEQTGLGEASDEALKQAEVEYKEAVTIVNKRKSEYNEVQKKFAQMQEVWSLQKEQKEYEVQLSNLEKQNDHYEQQRKDLQKAQDAIQIKPYAMRLKQAQFDKKQYSEELLEKKTAYERHEKAYEKALTYYEKVRSLKAKEEPQLAAKKEKLNLLIEIEEDLKQLQKKAKQLEEKRNQADENLKNKKVEYEKSASLLQKAQTKQKQLKEELSGTVISAQIRENVQQALQLKLTYEHLQEQAEEIENTVKKKQHQLNEAAQAMKEAAATKENQEKSITHHFENLQQLYSKVCERERDYIKITENVEAEINELKHKQEKERMDHLAVTLRKQLEAGEPCPVCGSSNHELTSSETSNHMQTEETTGIKPLEALLSESEQDKQQLYTLKLRLEEQADHYINEHSFLQETRILTDQEKESLLLDDYSRADEIKERKEQLSTEVKALYQDFLSIKSASKRTGLTMKDVMNQIQQYEQGIGALQQDLNEQVQKHEKMRERLFQLGSDWKSRFPKLPKEELGRIQQEIQRKDKQNEQLEARIQKSITFMEETEKSLKVLQTNEQELSTQLLQVTYDLKNIEQQIKEKEEKIRIETNGESNPSALLLNVTDKLTKLAEQEKQAYDEWQNRSNQLTELKSQLSAIEKSYETAVGQFSQAEKEWLDLSSKGSFQSAEEALQAILDESVINQLKQEIERYTDKKKQCLKDLNRISEKLADKRVSQEKWEEINKSKENLEYLLHQAAEARGAANNALESVKLKHKRFAEIESQKQEIELRIGRLEKLQTVLKGNSFVEYMAEEQLEIVSRHASMRLSELTRQRYAIEVDSQGGFMMRDDANGGVKRPVSTLSGGETFLTSLALAISLSTHIQLRGEYPLQFFFLDEGFGTLDSELLDTVITALEKLQSEELSVGVISHVQELRARLPKRLVVTPAESSGKGTTVKLETL
ncbi:AAA family ATPase [Metabacillus arenae]|uniref:Nuclease SbcCD subunit C n=1 Tax=Metabacillus arenae TaxID=2771434 RepID=A0A926NHE7_9BACI|nr:SMC family ATPase [Metabacillus arenae]MBD1380623.1 SMC family ATPase [Metabacillus arenae]